MMAKEDHDNQQRKSINATHGQLKRVASGNQRGVANPRHTMKYIKADRKWVCFAIHIATSEVYSDSATTIFTSRLGADDTYPSKANIAKAKMLILRKSTKRITLANGGMGTAMNVILLPIPRLSKKDSGGPTIHRFPDLAIKCWKSKQQRQCVDVYKERHHSAQRK